MNKLEYYISSSDRKTQLRILEWIPECKPIGIIQIAHGVTEHIGRYEDFAEFFTKRGYVVIGNDHIGHGLSVVKDFIPMYFGIKGGWNYVVDDLYSVTKLIKNKYPYAPIYLLGFSLGSYAVRHYLIKYPNIVTSSILIGTGKTSFIENKIAELIADWQIKKYGDTAITDIINQLTFGTYNKNFSNEIGYDWLCAYKPSLDSYLNDTLRGQFMTAGLFRELLRGMDITRKSSNLKKMNKDTHILLLSGEEDPVGNFTKGVIKFYNKLKNIGMKNVSYKTYQNMRHDILHEENCKEVYCDIYKWINNGSK